jgi:uncharacterized RDD family membrane protein YckC
MNIIKKQRIGFGPRVGAFIIDSFIITILASILMALFMESTFNAFISGQLTEAIMNNSATPQFTSQEAYDEMMRVSLFIAHFSTLYMIIEAFLGATPGKMLMGIKIGTQDGKTGDIWLYFPRFALKNGSVLLELAGRITGIGLISSIAGLLGMAVFFGCFFVLGEKRQALHDTIARTAVFRKNELT